MLQQPVECEMCRSLAAQFMETFKPYPCYSAGQVTQHPPPPPPPLPGGILGDEMGLGKTAEMHALMVARPRQIDPNSSSKPSRASDSPAPAAMDIDDEDDLVSDPAAERRSSGKHASSSKADDQAANGCGVRPDSNSNMRHSGSRAFPGQLAPGHNLVVCPTQLKDQWINEVLTLEAVLI